jgi:raffinose/stachyose/melibiose transport system substrate-binding protein
MALLGALILGTSFSASAQEAITLHVFGPSSESILAGRLPPEAQKPIYDQVINGFLKENPNVKAVEWDAQGTQGNSLQRLMTARLAGQPIDLLYCTGTLTNGFYVGHKIVKPITSEIAAFKDRFAPSALADFTVNGENYAVPLSDMSSSAIYYNVDMFKKLGVQVPTSYDELKAAAPVFTAAGVTPLLHQGANAVMWPMWYFEAFAQSSGDSIGKTITNLSGSTKFTDAADTQAFALIKKWVDDGIMSKESLSVDRDGMRAAFANGKSAMYYGGTWEIPSLLKNVKDFEWSVFPFPQMPDVAGKPKHGGGADRALCLPSDLPAERQEAAVRFLEYVSRPEVASLYLTPETPIFASVKGVAGSQLPVAKVLSEKVFPDNVKFLDWIWPTQITQAVASAVAGVVGEQITPEQASQNVQKAYDDLVVSGEWPPKD